MSERTAKIVACRAVLDILGATSAPTTGPAHPQNISVRVEVFRGKEPRMSGREPRMSGRYIQPGPPTTCTCEC